MTAFFPNTAIDKAPLPPSKSERITSRLIGAGLVPVMLFQMTGAVPLHTAHDAGLGSIGDAVDSIFDLFNGIVSTAVPQLATWLESLPVAVVHGVYFGALALFIGSMAANVTLGMLREQRNPIRRAGDIRSW